MVDWYDLRLGQRVRYGGKEGVVDGMTMDSAGVMLDGGGYVIAGYKDLYYVEETGRAEGD